jgi:hypothetical protein
MLWTEECGSQYVVLGASAYYREPLEWSADDFARELQSPKAMRDSGCMPCLEQLPAQALIRRAQYSSAAAPD